MKHTGEEERYIHLNANLQRIAKRYKRASLSDQCKKIEKNNRIRKTKDLLKNIKDTKGNFHAKVCTVEDKNGMDLTETEDIKEKWQEYTEELYKEDLHEPDNTIGVI